MLRFRNR